MLSRTKMTAHGHKKAGMVFLHGVERVPRKEELKCLICGHFGAGSLQLPSLSIAYKH